MSFGVFNTLANFQGYINKILAKKLYVFVIVYLDNILIYTENDSHGHVKAVQWVLNLLRKNGLFVNLKNFWFHQDEVCFQRYVVSAQEVPIEDEKIEAIKNWLEPKFMNDIQVFLRCVNFYQRFIQGFNKIAGSLTSMLRTTWSAKNLSSLIAKNAEVSSIGGGDCEDKTVERSPFISKNSNKAASYLTPEARLAFTQLKKVFSKAPILQQFDPKCHIWIETDTSSYAIGRVLSQLTLDNLDQWHPVAFYS